MLVHENSDIPQLLNEIQTFSLKKGSSYPFNLFLKLFVCQFALESILICLFPRTQDPCCLIDPSTTQHNRHFNEFCLNDNDGLRTL